MQSHPLWVRGLKQVIKEKEIIRNKSHPLWVRGLKPVILLSQLSRKVASFMGAWIETLFLITLQRYE